MIAPEDVKEYTSFELVKERTDDQLKFDIIQAKRDIFKYCGHEFEDDEYNPLPEEVKLAFIKMAEYYALVNSDESIVKGIRSEKLGDYSYTLGDGKLYTISLDALLIDHIKSSGKKGTMFRMRSL